tara:strand:- start:681 stop:1967 length:1287 start_codon:yes stop_codon:yes gene_type:complete
MIQKKLKNIANEFRDYDPNSLNIDIAKKIILKSIHPQRDYEEISLKNAFGRVLAEDIISPINVPRYDNSAMDGFSLCASQIDLSKSNQLKIIETLKAGEQISTKIKFGECIKIMTGAVIPNGCDSVVASEKVVINSNKTIIIPANTLNLGDNIKTKGEDLKVGLPALKKGKLLGPADIGLIASLGIEKILILKKIKVAYFSTGNELISVGEELKKNTIYDSNRFSLHGLLSNQFYQPIDLGIIKDNPELIETEIKTACKQADVLITTGGISEGEADFVKETLLKLGDILFWKILMKPGKPFAFGKLFFNGKEILFFALPGNPVAAIVSFQVLVKESLKKRSGIITKINFNMKAISLKAIKKRKGRTEFLRGILKNNANGECIVSPTESQGSGILKSLSESNCIIRLDEDQENINKGDNVNIIFFDNIV